MSYFDSLMASFFIVLFICGVAMMFGLFKNILSDKDNYIKKPEPPPKPKAKWRIDLSLFGGASDKYPYRAQRYNKRFDDYDVMMWFTTYEEALEFVNKNYDMPVEFYEKPEAK